MGTFVATIVENVYVSCHRSVLVSLYVNIQRSIEGEHALCRNRTSFSACRRHLWCAVVGVPLAIIETLLPSTSAGCLVCCVMEMVFVALCLTHSTCTKWLYLYFKFVIFKFEI